MGNQARDKLATETKIFFVPHTDFGIASSTATLPTAGDATSLGRVSGTIGSASPLIVGTTTNGGATASVSETARTVFGLPNNYLNGTDITVRLHARVSVVRGTSATVDVSAYRSDFEGGVGSDLISTAATNVNGANTWADRDFTLAGATLAPGDYLDILLTGASNDTSAANNGRIEIGSVSLLLSVKG